MVKKFLGFASSTGILFYATSVYSMNIFAKKDISLNTLVFAGEFFVNKDDLIRVAKGVFRKSLY